MPLLLLLLLLLQALSAAMPCGVHLTFSGFWSNTATTATAAAAAAAVAGSERSYTTWREADLEWLGVKPDIVQTSVFEMGRESPNAQEHNTVGVCLFVAASRFLRLRLFDAELVYVLV
jgi:hypothetical protein